MFLEPRISIPLKNSNGAELLSGYMNAQRQDEREPLITPKTASIILQYLEYNDYLIYVDANGELSIADVSEDFTGEGQGCCTNKDIIDEVLDSVNAAADYGYDVYNEETANIIQDLFKYYDVHEPLFIRSWGDLQRTFDFDKDRELSHYSAQELNPKDPNSPDVKKAVINHILQSKVSSYGFDGKKTELGELCDSYSHLIVYKYNSDFELNSFFEKDFFKAISLKVAEKEKHDISYAVTEDDINTCRPLGFDYSNSENLVTLYQLKTIFVNTLKSRQSTTGLLQNAIFHCTEKARNSEFGKLLCNEENSQLRKDFTEHFLNTVNKELSEIHVKEVPSADINREKNIDEIIDEGLKMDSIRIAGEKFIGELNKNLSFYKNNPWLTMKIVIDDLKKNSPDEHKLLLEYFKRENLNCKSAYDSFFEKNLGVKKTPEIKKDISNKPEKKQPDKSEPSFGR